MMCTFTSFRIFSSVSTSCFLSSFLLTLQRTQTLSLYVVSVHCTCIYIDKMYIFCSDVVKQIFPIFRSFFLYVVYTIFQIVGICRTVCDVHAQNQWLWIVRLTQPPFIQPTLLQHILSVHKWAIQHLIHYPTSGPVNQPVSHIYPAEIYNNRPASDFAAVGSPLIFTKLLLIQSSKIHLMQFALFKGLTIVTVNELPHMHTGVLLYEW